tara:strand:+ start:699 stop:1424 length:726 start_codon:yes stop_codon:yes gene_type:complete
MGLLQIKYVDAVPVVQKNVGAVGALTVGTTYKILVPRYEQDDLEVEYTPASGERELSNLRFHVFEQLKNEGFLIGALSSEAVDTIIRIQNLDLADDRIVNFDGITTELEDDKGNDYSSGTYDPFVQNYNKGVIYTIPFDQITKVTCDATEVKLYYGSGTSHIKFTIGTIDVSEIDRVRIPTSSGNTGSISEVAITASYLSSVEDLYILEQQLFDAIISAEEDGIHILDYDTKNISATHVAS